MNQISFPELQSLIRSNSLKYYNFYNTDLNLDSYFTVKYYLNNPNDNVDKPQILNTLFLDIEAFIQTSAEMDNYDGYINAITTYFTKDKTYRCYFLLIPDNLEKFGITQNIDYEKYLIEIHNKYKKELIESNHIKSDENIIIKLYNNEIQLITDCWEDIKSLDPALLSGWNSDTFDFPYMYNRLLKLNSNNKQDTDKVFSKFGIVESASYGKMIKIPEFVICDLMHMYKPRAEGGMNYGDTLQAYSLDYVSEIELNLKKFSYKSKNLSITDFYLQDPINFLLYNLIDVCLTARLNEKLQFMDLHNNIRRTMICPFQYSMIGSSAIFDSYVMNELFKNNKYIRHGLASENNKAIPVNKLSDIIKPKTKKGYITPNDITLDEYSSTTVKYDGAYVKETTATIINDGSLIIDLDATGLYPSMMLQSNISFDAYKIRILPPTVYNTLSALENGLSSNVLNQLSTNVIVLIEKYIDISSVQNKEKAFRNLYYITMFLLYKFVGKDITQIFNPVDENNQILLNTYLLPLLDVINTIHPNKQPYNQVLYDYFFDEDSFKKYKHFYIVDNIDKPNKTIVKVTPVQLLEYLNKYSITITGCCFEKHEKYLGLFNNMLTNMRKLRNYYKNEMKKYPDGSYEHGLNNNRQLTYKTLMNSCYGVMGLKSFRYSDHWLAQTITTQGKLMLKIATYFSEEYLKLNYR